MSTKAAEALVDVRGVVFRPDDPVTFKSGIQSPVYCDNRRLPFFPAQWRTVIEGFAELVAARGVSFDVVGGIETAGIPHSSAFAYSIAKPSIFVRKAPKEHGTKRRVEGGDVTGKTVLLIEDLVTTGGSSLSGVEALRAEGAEVRDCLAIISYGFPEATEQFAAAGVKLHPLTTFADVLAVVQARGMIDEAGAATVRDWLRDPHGWADRR
ncbi:MAG TPA: orotate phosphoribosyltransferase [Acidobacteriaceae bacterium]|jgi:orotate phosphoribosyltransferase